MNVMQITHFLKNEVVKTKYNVWMNSKKKLKKSAIISVDYLVFASFASKIRVVCRVLCIEYRVHETPFRWAKRTAMKTSSSVEREFIYFRNAFFFVSSSFVSDQFHRQSGKCWRLLLLLYSHVQEERVSFDAKAWRYTCTHKKTKTEKLMSIFSKNQKSSRISHWLPCAYGRMFDIRMRLSRAHQF